MNLDYDLKQEIKNAFNDLKSPKTFKKQIPNLLTASRLVAPFVIVPLALTGNIAGATIAVAATALTDGLDGFCARKLGVTSKLGKDLDAFTDKIFALGITLPLVFFKPELLVTLGLEGIISAINVKSKMKGADVRSSILGKIKTGSLSLLIATSYLGLTVSIPSFIVPTLFVANTLLQTGAIIDYKRTNDKKIKELEIKEEEKQEIIKPTETEKEIELLKSIKNNLTNTQIKEEKQDVKVLVKKN